MHWLVRLSAAASADFQDIIDWTDEQFGVVQGEIYELALKDALSELVAGPEAVGVKARADLGSNIYTVHMGRRGRPGRHVIVFRTTDRNNRHIVEIIRILHDAMDVGRQLPRSDEAK